MSDIAPTVKPPPRAQVVQIIDRFLKPEVKWPAPREMPVFYRLWKQFPDVDFWTHWDLPFKLNSMLWFGTADGREALVNGYAVYRFTFPADAAQDASTASIPIDTSRETVYDHPIRPPSIRRPTTVGAFLKGAASSDPSTHHA